ncbi:MAG: radical SAM family heme chaperone HemW [Chitinivibrionales bacterium]|nr:radical SAM family heme chaperone HemW [Chitinivibrionales bacterium]
MDKKISLYIHIPFCTQKCRYCDFYSLNYSEEYADRFIEALAKEWESAASAYNLEDAEVTTLYFGGGTPGRLSTDQWEAINELLITEFPLADGCEFTIECNPESFTDDKALMWHQIGVTRLSIGIQSLANEELAMLGRCHTMEQALDVCESSVIQKFKSTSIDLMYGLPGQTVDSLNKTLETLLRYNHISHLSAYELTIHEGTPFWEQRKVLPLPIEDMVVEMTSLIDTTCSSHGLYHYEISNYAKDGFRCRHNYAYWEHKPYLGLGPSAHSYLHPYRFANTDSLDEYLIGIKQGKLPVADREKLDPQTLAGEILFLGLRTVEGVCEERLYAMTGIQLYTGLRRGILDNLFDSGYIIKDGSQWKLTEKGMLIADEIARRLM